jgi:hypothetical protein
MREAMVLAAIAAVTLEELVAADDDATAVFQLATASETDECLLDNFLLLPM